MSVAATSSRMWSCDTLQEGVNHVSDEAAKLEQEEKELELQIQAMEAAKLASTAVTDQVPTIEIPDDMSSAETLEATAEQLAAAGLKTTVAPPEDAETALPPEARGTRPIASTARGDTDPDDADNTQVDATMMPPPAPPGQTSKKRSLTRQEKLREAAKARLRRMCADHKKKRGLNVPDWVKEQWKKREQNAMAKLLMDANWDKEKFILQLEIVVKQKNTVTVVVEEQWMSEKELRDELKWSPLRIQGAKKVSEAKADTHVRKNQYDGVTEYLVVLREKGSRQEEKSQEEIHRKIGKADEAPVLDPEAFSKIAAMDARLAADKALPKDAVDTSGGQEQETATKLKKFLDSLLQKSGKLRSLVRDLRENYSECESTTGYIASLQKGLGEMDAEYDRCQLVYSTGESSLWKDGFVSKATDCMKAATIVAGKASAIEKKIQNAKRYEKKDNKAEESGKPGKNVNTGTEKKRAQEPDTIESAPPPRKSRKQKN